MRFVLPCLLSISLLMVSSAQAAILCNPFGADTLEQQAVELEKAYPDFPHLSPNALDAGLHSKTPPMLLDVREPEEYAVSHLPGAIRISPNANAAEVRRAIGKLKPGTELVFYCAVGVRSSRLAKRVGSELLADGASRISNLRGGIFAWHNVGLTGVNAQGETPVIHPYDDCRARWVQPPLRAE